MLFRQPTFRLNERAGFTPDIFERIATGDNQGNHGIAVRAMPEGAGERRLRLADGRENQPGVDNFLTARIAFLNQECVFCVRFILATL
jgi:hypothetical protein